MNPLSFLSKTSAKAENAAPRKASASAARPFVPDVFVAGCVPDDGPQEQRRNRPWAPAELAARNALDEVPIRMVVHKHEGKLYYIAARADQFASLAHDTSMPLSAVLPGAAGHKGPGVYARPLGQGRFSALAVLPDGQVQSFCQTSMQELRRVAGSLELSIIEAFDERDAMDWTGAVEHQAAQVRKVAHVAFTACAAVAVISTAAAVVSLMAKGHFEPLRESLSEQFSQDMAAQVASLNQAVAHRAPAGFDELDKVSQTAVALHGRVLYFSQSRNTTKYELELPAATTAEDLRALGPVTTELSGSYLRVRKNAQPR